MTNLLQPSHPALEAAINECSAAARDMEALEYRIEVRAIYSEAWAVKVRERWERAMQALTNAARLAGKNAVKRSPSGTGKLYTD